MSRRVVLLLISILYIAIIFVIGQNINLLKNKLRRDKEALGYKEYIEYVAWENMMLIENPDCKDPKILIDVSEKTLYILDGNKLINKYPVATGKSSTPTPLGSWRVVGKARWGGGFGTRWMGLNIPWGEYGIHGTSSPYSIGTSASGGCIRMYNRDVEDLYKYVKEGTPVAIINGLFGPFGYGFQTISPGNIGADVMEVQSRLRAYGYYDVDHLDGWYGPNMERALYEFQKDHNLPKDPHIGPETFKALGIVIMD